MASATGPRATTYYGSQVQVRTLAGVRLVETLHRAGDRIAPHAHSTAFVTFVLRGGYVESRGGRSVRCSAGCAILHEAGERHEDRFGALETHLLNVEWSGSDGSLPTLRPLVAEGPAPRRIAVALVEELYRSDSASRLVVESAIAEIAMFGHLEKPARADAAPWLRRTEERLRDEYRHPPGLAELARDAGVHRSHLARSFRARYGRTIGEFVRELRIGWARERLRRGAAIAEVAAEAGFADQSHMTRWFQRTLGRTPARVRTG